MSKVRFPTVVEILAVTFYNDVNERPTPIFIVHARQATGAEDCDRLTSEAFQKASRKASSRYT